jgi:hypothetical protein
MKVFDKIKSTVGVRTNPYTVVILGAVLLFTALIFMGGGLELALSLALFIAPLWLPVLLVRGAWHLWHIWRRSDFIAAQKTILLEVKPPRSLVKTPLAMEAFLQGMHHASGEGTWYARSILGKTRPWWSLEIASIEGKVHFFVWTRTLFRKMVESQLYAQYPGVQVVEAPDYTRLITAEPAEWAIWGCDFDQTKEDPYPIKTYVDYGLDKVQKEPEQVDPLSNLIEFMGTLGKGEYLWLQLIIRVHKGEKYGGKYKNWRAQGQAIIDQMRKDTREEYTDPATGKKIPSFPNPTKGQLETMAAIDRNTAKLAFDVGARGVYIARPERFDPMNISGLVGIYKQFSSEGWNGFKPSGWMTDFDDYPWEMWLGIDKLKNEYREGLIQAFRRRQAFYEPFITPQMVMSTEEIATLYHIPSRAVESPALERIQSATAEAPANLPT